MTDTTIARRRLVAGAGAAAAAALLPLQQAIAQAAATNGDWLDMVRAQHSLIARTFDDLFASVDRTYVTRDRLIDKLGYQLTAHSVAEENVLYPAIAMNGLLAEADKLYLDQAHAKVMNMQLELVGKSTHSPDTTWLEKAKALQLAIMMHARDDEEAGIYPRLQGAMDDRKNKILTRLFAREFATVKPRRSTI